MTHRRRFRWIAWGALAVVAGCAVTASRPAAIDPQADDILKRMCDTISAAPTLAFEADAQVDERLDTGRLVRLHRHSKVIAARPDRLFVEMAGDEVGGRFWYEKGRLTVLDRGANAYASIAVPDRTEKMLDYVVEKYHVTVPLADLFFPNLYETLTESIESGVYVGVESVEGRDCHHLAFSQVANHIQRAASTKNKPGTSPNTCRPYSTSEIARDETSSAVATQANCMPCSPFASPKKIAIVASK